MGKLLMMISLNDIEINATNECKGLIFRGYVTHYIGVDYTTLNERKGLKLLKRKSCNGCEGCGNRLEMIGEYLNDGLIDFSPVEDGKLYRIAIVNIVRDWETGIIDEWEYEIVEYNENEENN